MMFRFLFGLSLLLSISTAKEKDSLNVMSTIPAGIFHFPFRTKGLRDSVYLQSFELDQHPVNTEQFLNFLTHHPEFSKTKIKPLFADSQYLSSLSSQPVPTIENKNNPITEVSWYVAKAYCEANGKRLPSTAEWEKVATTIPQGKDSASYYATILDWYARPTLQHKALGTGSANAYGVFDLHGKVWEWTSDFNTSGPITAASKEGKSGSFFCGGAGEATADGVDYATFMRYSFRSSLQPHFSVSSLGFRCAQGPE